MMNNVWDFADYKGKIKITTKDGEKYLGFVSDVEDKEDDDAYEDDCINIYCDDGIWGIFQNEIEKIEKLD
ncbi:MAG: hypothetical protein IJO22_06105 [Oscillospiraceae bacterium]|nr:hypothetical protein [Oscillospiraceae bacterium]